MSVLQNTAAFFYVILFCISWCSFSFAVPIGVIEVLEYNNNYYSMIVLLQPIDIDAIQNDGSTIKGRVKRQAGAGKFTDSAKMSATKLLRLQLQMWRNFVSKEPIGGRHPLAETVPRPVVQLFKQRFIEYFFPNVGEDKVDEQS